MESGTLQGSTKIFFFQNTLPGNIYTSCNFIPITTVQNGPNEHALPAPKSLGLSKELANHNYKLNHNSALCFLQAYLLICSITFIRR